MSDDDQPAEYGLVMPFVTTVSHGGPHDDDAYVAGIEMGRLDALLEHQRPRVHDQPIHAANAEQADLIAMRRGYVAVLSEEQVEGWRHLWLTRAPGGVAS